MRLKTDFPGDEPLILYVLFPLLQLIALLPISKFKFSTIENPRGCMCQEKREVPEQERIHAREHRPVGKSRFLIIPVAL